VLEQIKLGLAQDVRNAVAAFTPAENAAWEQEKSSCSFCTYFLESPCAQPFRQWSQCVDLAKARQLDYISTCSVYTTALMACTEREAQHFEALRNESEEAPKGEAEVGAGAGAAGGVVAESTA